ncbi:NAD(P)/FAD-dependent oxidoreductase [Alkaliphilus pronyensis]|uniref:NAD(P)/FAD-dependent oxidoreductase n=1 Tax=Alkaliphilus pronyensis TaxID=1482732 RepID=A0A6I0FBK8_9FIRM|nr:NAD(P)/FAD-dependent oxidoreductase [Alkaliphilus pronyensis]KAB3534880.1 NAD(P)/FAD-dependent oxidoreductase [Alkaliphilus pronyensis]
MKMIVIIGGGVAGLSAGIFAQKNGFESIILEKHHTPGGECTGWNREGYHIDGCIHWLVGTKEGTSLHKLWTTVGALEDVDIYHPDTFMSCEHGDFTVNLYRDIDKLRSSWISISPEDKAEIEILCEDVSRLNSFEIPTDKPMDLMNVFEKIKLFASMKEAGTIIKKYSKIALKEYASRFKHPAIRNTLANFLPEGYSASTLFFALASFANGNASIPYGGSKEMAMRMAKKYTALGGKIVASCEALKLIINEKKVSRVICKDGETFEADYFIAACDAHVLYEGLLEGKYNDKAFQMRYNNPKDYPLASNIYVALGYEGLVGDIPRTLRFPINSFKINGSNIEHLTLAHYSYEPSFAPEGHTVLTCAINQFQQDYDEWSRLTKNKEAYKQEKLRIGNEVVEAIIKRFPEMEGKIKVLDVVTPITYERYCNAYRGSFMAFLPTIEGKSLDHSGKIKGINNIFLSGQWLQPPGGLPVAVVTGKDTIMRICKKEKQSFIS